MYEFLLKIANDVGIAGVVCLLVAFFMLNSGRWQAQGLIYQLANFIGAALILFSLLFYWNLSAVIMEICWMLISILGIYRAFCK